MNEYELGKDIQTILHRLDKIEAASTGSSNRKCGGCGRTDNDSESTVSTYTYRDQPELTDDEVNALPTDSSVCVILEGLLGSLKKRNWSLPLPHPPQPQKNMPHHGTSNKSWCVTGCWSNLCGSQGGR